ncbi:MAG: DMT family transporter [Candidatus Aenigmarchaeota archaeon]|nr:DMT family transporter [Candidatus Aenigmarchaeota archaeon]
MSFSLGIMFAIVSFLGWGVADFFAKRVVDRIGAFWSLLIMQIIGIVPIFIYSLLFLQIPMLSWSMVGILALSSFLLIFAYLVFYKGLKYGPISIVSPIASSATVLTVLLSILLFGESLTSLQMTAIIIIITGAVLASVKWGAEKIKIVSYGVLLAIITALGWGVAFPLMKINMNVVGPIFTLLIVRFFSIIFLSAYAAAKRDRPKNYDINVWKYLIVIGLIDAAAFLAYYIGVSMDYLSIISPISTCYPAVTVVLAYVFLKERIQNSQKIGIFLILAGLILISLV